jgi:hypothetical protein
MAHPSTAQSLEFPSDPWVLFVWRLTLTPAVRLDVE